LATAALANPQHDAYAVASHLQKCLKHPVFFTLPVARQLSADGLPACEKDTLEAWLATHKLKGFWNESLLLIDDPKVYSRHETLYDWSIIKLQVSFEAPGQEGQDADMPNQYKYYAVRRPLSQEEVKSFSDWILNSVAMPPVESPMVCSSCDGPPRTAVLKLRLSFEAVKLSSDGAERIIGWMGSSAVSRIIVAHHRGGSFGLDWISPLLGAYRQGMIYRDVSADGVAEIWSLSAYPGASSEPWQLSIFDVNGVELTRNGGDCSWFPDPALVLWAEMGTPLPVVCPIVGLPAIDHFLEEDGTVALEAYRDFRGSDEEPRRYRFLGGKYVLDTMPKSSARPTCTGAAELNKQAMGLFREKKYREAAAKFEEAAQLEPTNSQIANDAGFAYYKLENYEQSVAWFKKAIAIDPRRAVAYRNLGDAYAKLNRNTQARQAYNKYLELAPNSKSAPDVKKKVDALPPTP